MKQLTTIIIFLSFIANGSAQFLIRIQDANTNTMNNTFTCNVMISALPDTRIGPSDFVFTFNVNNLSSPSQTGGFASVQINGSSIFVNVDAGGSNLIITSTPTLLASFSFIKSNNNNNNSDISCVSNNVFKMVGNSSVEGTAFCESSLLPIALIKFQAQPTEEGNFLTWETGTEINTSHFDIESSLDGKKFGKIGEITSKGKAASYDFLDKHPLSNTVYYRLKSNDLDGQFQYSKIISISSLRQKGLSVKVFPNPFSQDLSIDISTSKKSDLNIQIIDVLGRSVYQIKTKDTEGVLVMPIPTDFLSSGSYFLNVTDGERSTQQKIVKF